MSQKRKTSATKHGNASRKCKTSATHYGNAFLVCMFQIDVSKRVLPKRSKPLILNAFGRFSESHWSTPEVDMKKWISGSGRPRALMAMVQSIHFSNTFCKLCSSESIPFEPSIFEKPSKTMILITFRTPSLRPCWSTHWNIEKRKTSATLHGNAPVQNETSATQHENVF